MIGGSAPNAEVVERFAEQLRALGAEVWLAGMSDVERTHADRGLTGVRSLRSRATDSRTPEFFRRSDQLGLAEETWSYVEADDWVLDRADRSDVLIAIDARAVYSVWQLASRNPHPAAVFGLDPGLTATREVVASPRTATIRQSLRQRALTARRRSRRAAGRAIATGAASALGRSTAGGSTIRLLARGSRSAATAAAVARIAALEERGRNVEADKAIRLVVPTSSSTRRRADFLGLLAFRHLAAGQQVPLLVETIEAELAYADELFAKGDRERAAASFGQVLRLAFHRGNHLDTTWSALADDPTAFTEPFRRSAVVRELNRARGRLAPAELQPPSGERPRRVLIATLGNTNFLGDIMSRLGARNDVEVRSILPSDMGAANQVTRDPRKLISSLLGGDGRAERLAERGLRRHLDWADVLLIDWCTHLPRVFQLLDPGTTRVMVRLHSYEAFTPWPLLLDASRLDRLIFVSDHIRDLTLAERPDLTAAGVDTPVVTNGVDLRRFVRPKSPDARFTVALVGYKVVAKDVRWALKAVTALRRRDRRYRLKLIGAGFEDFLSPAAAHYAAEFHREAARLEADGGLAVIGHVDDVAGALTDAGTVLCSSVREGSPVGVVEAVASGCVPVIRDWPFFAGDGRGARALYPAEWVVETPEEAADRLYRVTQDEQVWSQESGACATRVLQEWDVEVVGSDYDKLFDLPGAQVPGAS